MASKRIAAEITGIAGVMDNYMSVAEMRQRLEVDSGITRSRQEVAQGLQWLRSEGYLQESTRRNNEHIYRVRDRRASMRAICAPWLRPSGMRLIKQLEELECVSDS